MSLRKLFKTLKSRKTNNKFVVINIPITPKSLNLGCSGGGGHNAAIESICEIQKKEQYDIPEYDRITFKQKISGMQSHRLNLGLKVLSKHIISWFVKPLPVPTLPTQQEVTTEVKTLDSGKAKRPYIDMLLDIYPTGYQNAAIWNILQRQDRVGDLKKLVNLQSKSDRENYGIVKNAIYKMLKDAYKSGKPYTELNCTQAMALPAVCDAVIKYNKKFFPKIRIKQYMTDLATDGAIHFLPVLAKLSKEQKAQMELYGVGLSSLPSNLKKSLHPHDFANCIDIDPANNPMVRPGFKDSELQKISFDKELEIRFKTYEFKEKKSTETKKEYELKETEKYETKLNDKGEAVNIKTPAGSINIKPDQKVAAIMLGSQAGLDTIEYVKELLHSHDRIFVFGGQCKRSPADTAPNPTGDISDGIDKVIAEMVQDIPSGKERDEMVAMLNRKIIRLGNQSDQEMGPILTRAQTVITRAGGLSVMEQMALNAAITPEMAKDKKIFIHHKESGKPELFSGIAWEDANCKKLIEFLIAKGITAEKTSTHRISDQLRGEKELKAEFSEKLSAYIEYQAKQGNKPENNVSVSAAFKMLKSLNDVNAILNSKELSALQNGELSELLGHYEKLNIVPENVKNTPTPGEVNLSDLDYTPSSFKVM